MSIRLSGILIAIVSVSACAQNIQIHRTSRHQRYKLIDLGTFGGPEGYINPEGNGGPYINDRGVIVGNTQNTTPLPSNADGFLCYPGPNVNHAFVWREHHTIDLGALPPAITTAAMPSESMTEEKSRGSPPTANLIPSWE